MILYPIWYRRFGVRRLPNFTIPLTFGISKLALPQGAVINWFPEDTVNFGPSAEDTLIKTAERMVFIEHITEMRSDIGNPKPTPFIMGKPLRDYQRKNRAKLRLLMNPQATFANQRTIVLENFSPLLFTKRYTTSFFANYYRWVNIRHTMWKHINDLIEKQPERHQFVRMILPEVLPPLPSLRLAEKRIDRTTLSKLKGWETYNLLDMFQWLGELRAEGPMAHLKEANLSKVDMIFQSQDKWFCINLGLLDSWRAKIVDGKKTDGIDPFVLQKRFLKAMMTLQEAHTIVEIEDEAEQETDEDDLHGVDNEKPKPTPKRRAEDLEPVALTDEEEMISDASFQEEMERHLKEDLEQAKKDGLMDDDLEGDLDGLTMIEENAEVAEEEATTTELIVVGGERKSMDQGIVEKANELADTGMVSGAEYRRLMKLANSYKEIPNPYGKGTLADHMVIKPESLKITKPVLIPDSPTVFDKSMLQSSLLEFDKRYLEDILPKDVVNSVMSIQNAGVAVTSYEVEDVEDVLNHYEIHTIKLTPATGQSSTIRFKIPKVDSDGSYLANGVRYSLRKQRGDVPIRKVSSSRVALTSYYGKVFVERSERAVNNYPKWLCNKIRAIGLDDKDKRVTEIKPSNVFDHLLNVPKLYSTLAQHFRRFKAVGIEFVLEYTKREEEFGAKAVQAAEGKGLVVIGRKGSELVVVDNYDTLYAVKARGLEPLGKIEELLELHHKCSYGDG